MLSSLRKIRLPSSPHIYSFSNYSTDDFLKDYHGPCDVPVKVLVFSCGDLPFSVQSTTLCSSQKIESITFTDESPVVMARNVLMAKIIIDTTFDPSNADDIHYLWDIWHNMEWSSKTLQRFLKDVSELIDTELSQCLHIPVANEKDVLQRIWKFWLLSASEMNAESMEKLHVQRYESIINHIQGIIFPKNPKPKSFIKPTLSEVWEWMVAQTQDHMNVSHLPGYHQKAISEEMRTYFETGNCYKNTESIVCINPMFLNPEITGRWALVSSVSPFEAYLNLKNFPAQDNFLNSCQSVLESQVTNYRKRLQETTFSFRIGDALELCYRGIWKQNFDIVDCSNLSDQLGLANILNAAQLALADGPHTILLTESSPWRDTTSSIRHYSAKEFIEESLSASIEMIPSLYGLMLINHVRLGNPLPLLRSWRPSVRLQWKRSPSFTNMRVDLSGAIGQFIEDIQLRCFGGSDNQETLDSFSPLTYCYLIASFTARVELDETNLKSLEQPSLSTCQELAWKTFQAWMNGHKVLNMRINLTILNPDSKEEGRLRLVFATRNETTVHHFENFELNRDNGCNLVVSFWLLDDHNLEFKSTVVYLESSVTSTPVTSSCLLTEATSTTLDFPIPFARKVESCAFLTCLEFEEFYHIELPGIQQEEIILSTDREPPSEAGHQITLIAGAISQTLTFPWPLKVADVHSSCEIETSSVRLVLPKSIYEPRPYEWKDRKRWDTNSMNPWDPENLLKDLCFHLCAQFEVVDLKRQVLSKTVAEGGASGLNGVREIVRMIIQTSVSDNNLLYVIQSKHDPSLKNLWFLRVHLPVRFSPLGSPILFVTANDHRLAKKFVDRGTLEQAEATKDFERIYIKGEVGSGVLPLFIYSDEEENLLRYLLRLNSTKILASTWPIEQIPTGENSPWLKTFVSPCYVDQVGTDAEMEDLVATTKSVNIQEENKKEPAVVETCSKCKQPKGNLKRCSRCRSVKYCSVECQRSDWTVHKSSCLH